MSQENIRHSYRPFIISTSLMAMAFFMMDVYLPSFPAIATALHANHTTVQLTISLYLLGFSLSQLVFGPLSDQLERRKVLLLGLSIAFVGSSICVIANNIFILILGRLIQGIGASAAVTLSRSILGDVYSGKQLAQFASHLSFFVSLVPMVAPTFGGYIQSIFGWRGNFVFLWMLIALSLLIVAKHFAETNPNTNPHAMKPQVLWKNYWHLLTHKIFIGYTICSCVAYSGIIAYATLSPFLFQNVLGLTPIQYGWLAILLGVGLVIVSLLNSFLLRFMLPKKIILFGLSIIFAGGLVMWLLYLMGYLNVTVIIVPMMCFTLGTKMIYSNAVFGTLEPFKKMAGTAAALYSGSVMFSSMLTSSVVALWHTHSSLPLAVILTVLGGLGLIVFNNLILRVENKT